MAFWDSMDNISMDKEIDFRIFKYILKRKNELIIELREKIAILKDQVQILNQQKRQTFAIQEKEVLINESKKPLFSEITKQNMQDGANHVILIKPKDQTQNCNKTKIQEDIKKNIKPEQKQQ